MSKSVEAKSRFGRNLKSNTKLHNSQTKNQNLKSSWSKPKIEHKFTAQSNPKLKQKIELVDVQRRAQIYSTDELNDETKS